MKINNKKIGIVIQARCGSKRFPNKINKKIYKNFSSLDFIIKRILKHFDKDKIILATSTEHIDKKLIIYKKKYKINFFTGSHNNLLKRYYDCAKTYNIDTIVRLTADCPLVDPIHIKIYLRLFHKKKIDYLSNCAPYENRTYAVGNDIEIFKFKSLKKYLNYKNTTFQKEHISPFFLKNFKKTHLVKSREDLSKFRYTLDYPLDLWVIKEMIKKSKNPINLKYKEIINILKKNKEISSKNLNYVSIYFKKKIKKGY